MPSPMSSQVGYQAKPAAFSPDRSAKYSHDQLLGAKGDGLRHYGHVLEDYGCWKVPCDQNLLKRRQISCLAATFQCCDRLHLSRLPPNISQSTMAVIR